MTGRGKRYRYQRYRGISRTKRKYIFIRDNYTCLCCGSKRRLTIDHIIPWSKGGGGERKNLQTLCESCNLEKGDKTINYLEMKKRKLPKFRPIRDAR